jgi:hypothetical protein
MIATSVEILQAVLRTNAFKYTVADYSDTVTKDIRFFHGMCSENNGASLIILAFLKNVPQLPPCLRVKPSRGLIQKHDLRVGHETNGDRKSAFHS